MKTFLNLQRARLIYPVGPKAVEHRPLKKFLAKTLPWIGAGMVVWVMTHPMQIARLADPVFLKAQVMMDHAGTAMVPASNFTYATRFQAEDLMSQGQYEKAVPLFLSAAESQQSLLASGRALRAAIQSRNPALIEQAGEAYNLMLDEVSLQSQQISNTSFMQIRRGIKVSWKWKAFSVEHLLDVWKKQSPTRFSEQEADTLLLLEKTHPGYFSYLGLYGIGDRDILSQLNRGEVGWNEILHFQGDYQAWLEGKWSSAENFAMGVTHELDLDRYRTEKIAPQSILEPYLNTSSKLEATSNLETKPNLEASQTGLKAGSVQDVFIRDHLGQGFTPWQIYELWFEQEMWGDAHHEVINPTVELNTQEEKMLALREEVRSWLQDIHSPQDLNAYYLKWQSLVDAHPVEFSSWTSNDGFQLQLGGSPGFAIDWIKRAQGLSGLDPNKMPAFLGLGTSQIGVVELKRAMALSASDFPQNTPKAPPHLSMKDAEEDLQSAVQEVGLRRLQWPVSIPNTPEKVWQMATLLRQANHELETVTQMQGEVLGLKGRSSLILNSTSYTYQDGLTSGIKQGQTSVLTFNSVVMGQQSLGPIGHEWLHAFDMVNAEHSSMVRRSDDGLNRAQHPVSTFTWDSTSQDWKKWWRQTLYPHIQSHEMQLAQQNLWLKDKVFSFPMLEGVLNQELASVRTGSWTPKNSLSHWNTIDSSNVSLKNKQELQKEIAYFQSMWTHPDQALSRSPWVNLSTQFNLQFQNMHNQEEGTEYSGDTAEMVARSFASQFKKGMVVREGQTERQNTNFMYPAKAERISETQAWGTLFKSQKKWWTSLSSMRVKMEITVHYSPEQLQIRREQAGREQNQKNNADKFVTKALKTL